MADEGAAHAETRRDLQTIFRAALVRSHPETLLDTRVSLQGRTFTVETEAETLVLDLAGYDRIIALGAGKASAAMARVLERKLGPSLSRGIIVVKHGQTERLERCAVLEAGHPVPDRESVRAAEAVARMAVEADPRCLVIGLISGGASSLLCSPSGLSLEEKQEVTRALLACGATIHEMNTVRKHLSGIKGGRLAAMIHPATSVNLILSDVVGDDLEVIGSGLTAPDPSTYGEALAIVVRRDLADRIPPRAREVLESGAAGLLPETPKPGDPVFRGCRNMVVGSNRQSALAAAESARVAGYNTIVLTTRLQGEARDAAALLLGIARDVVTAGTPVPPPACIITGGETTVTVRGSGRGGRNQELALAFLAGLGDTVTDRRISLLSASTDGNDGPTDAAGAFAWRGLAPLARVAGLDPRRYLAENDSYTFFDRVGGLLRTGPTGTNVCDLQILLVR